MGLPVLVGLFGVATALGTLGRAWSGPATLLAHLDSVGTAVVAAGTSVLVNNLPAASILAARVPPHPFALLVGLDIGPNLIVSGSLAWILWWRAARASGSEPPGRPRHRPRIGDRPTGHGRRTGRARRHRVAVSPAVRCRRPAVGGAAQPILSRSTTKTRVSLAAMPEAP